GILDLLEIRYCHSSRVGKGVRQYNYTLVVENEVGFGCSWSVCQFAADPALEICSVVGANHVFERCREKHCHRKGEKLLVCYFVSPREALHCTVSYLVIDQGRRADTVRVVDAALGIGSRDELELQDLLAQKSGMLTRVTEPLDGHCGAFKADVADCSGFARDIDAAPGGGVSPAFRPAQSQRFAGYDSRVIFPDDRFILVHHPGHDLRRGIYVRGRN